MSDATQVADGGSVEQTESVDSGATLQSTQVESTSESSGTQTEPESPKSLGWRKQLRQEFWENEEAAKFGNPSDLFQAYLEQQERLGKAVLPPGEDATEEDVQSFYKALGVPEDPSGYNLPDVEGMPEGYSSKFAQLALHAQLTPAQAERLMKADAENYLQTVKASKEASQKAEQELRKEFGDKFDEKVEQANKFLAKVGGDRLLKEFAKSPMGNNPDMVRFVVRMSEVVSEDSIESGKPGTGREASRSYTTGYPMLEFKGPLSD